MAQANKSAAVSHVGKIRSNNQDSGYAGSHLFVVADGMGGHAGGDVASALTVKHVTTIDRSFPTAEEAAEALHDGLLAANALLTETVFDHGELTGMGTTVSGMLLVGTKVAIAHIGDSRIYRLRDGSLEQITSDHTFVQRLVDSGRITEEEAAVHPRRSVLMRVLGDVDATPEIDTLVVDTVAGDRWLLCSDGLSSYVAAERIAAALSMESDAQAAAEKLVKESLDQGAPDNVTVVVVDIDGSGSASHSPAAVVGSAAGSLGYDGDTNKKPLRLPTLLLHPLKATKPDDSHFEPESEEFLDELIIEDRRRAKRRRISLIVVILLVIGALFGAGAVGYQYTQQQYYVGVNGSSVAIFRGVQQNIGPFSLHSVYRDTTLELDDLTTFNRKRIESTISASSLADAERIINQLTDDSDK
jgi:serine/threonine protein phosphatase PrpC